jgi:hypothetical protein
MKSDLFANDRYLAVQNKVREFLNRHEGFLSGSTASSTRAVGDAIQEILSANFPTIVGADVCAKYSSDFARRAMADLAFEDAAGCYYNVDVKTHRLSTKFNMPNLTSVERLARFYEDDRNYFIVLMIDYEIHELRAVVDRVVFIPIEFLGWDCLTIGALGWGQIQIANSNRLSIIPGNPRRRWMIELCDALLDFYPRELAKIDQRMAHFRKLRAEWESRAESD